MTAPARRQRSGWYAYQPSAVAMLPRWAVEVALSIEQPVPSPTSAIVGSPLGLLLVRSAGVAATIASALAEAMREVEATAGLRGVPSKLCLGRAPAAPGLEPMPPFAAHRQLRVAGQRGLVAAAHRRRSADHKGLSWQAGHGAVLCCASTAGLSAQAVVAVTGRGEPEALRPPAGGALLLRAWRPLTLRAGGEDPPSGWGSTAAVVLGASSPLGLGRAARHHAERLTAGGWHAAVLTGPAALEVARAGDPLHPAPVDAAHWTSGSDLAAMLSACLVACDLASLDRWERHQT